MLAFADRTPGMLAYVKQKVEHQRSVDAAIRDGRPPPEDPWNADELIAAYNQVRDEIERGTCPKCGGALGPTTTTNTDGKRYHPECARGW